MNITIDLEDFWMEDNSRQLSEQLKDHIKNKVVQEIWKDINDRVKQEITQVVYQKVSQDLSTVIEKTISDCIEAGKITPGGRGEEVFIKDYVKKVFEDNSGWGSPTETLKKLAQNFATEMKNRYDMLFASQVVAKVHELGLLKEEAAKALLQQNKQS